MKSIIKIFLAIFILTFVLIYTIFNIINKIELYDKTYFIGINDKRNDSEIAISDQIYEANRYNDYLNYLSKKVEVIDFSTDGILCEYIWRQGNRTDDVYAVLYKNKTIRYVIGNFTGLPSITNEDFKSLTGRDLNINSIYTTQFFTVKGNYKSGTIKLSNLQYFLLVSRIKIINIIDKGVNNFPAEPVADFVVGLYFNENCYPGNRVLSDTYTKHIRSIIHNTEEYFEQCIKGIENNN